VRAAKTELSSTPSPIGGPSSAPRPRNKQGTLTAYAPSGRVFFKQSQIALFTASRAADPLTVQIPALQRHPFNGPPSAPPARRAFQGHLDMVCAYKLDRVVQAVLELALSHQTLTRRGGWIYLCPIPHAFGVVSHARKGRGAGRADPFVATLDGGPFCSSSRLLRGSPIQTVEPARWLFDFFHLGGAERCFSASFFNTSAGFVTAFSTSSSDCLPAL